MIKPSSAETSECSKVRASLAQLLFNLLLNLSVSRAFVFWPPLCPSVPVLPAPLSPSTLPFCPRPHRRRSPPRTADVRLASSASGGTLIVLLYSTCNA